MNIPFRIFLSYKYLYKNTNSTINLDKYFLEDGNFAKKVETINSLEDVVTRTGKNLDIVFIGIAATLVSPPLAILGALLGGLCYSGRKNSSAKNYNYSKLKGIIYSVIDKYNFTIRRKLKEYGFKDNETKKFLGDTVYEGYIDSLIESYA